jgi:hypothetical protein
MFVLPIPKFELITGIILWAAATAGLCAFAMAELKLPVLYELLNNGVETTGNVEQIRRDEHNLIRYNFQVGDKMFRGGGNAADVDRNVNYISPGERVAVFYLDRDPNISTMGDPARTFYPNLRGTIFAALVPTFAAFVYFCRLILWVAPFGGSDPRIR